LTTEDDLVALLEESIEWKDDFAAEVLSLIEEYNMELEEGVDAAKQAKDSAKCVAQLKAKRMKGRPNGEDSDDYEIESEDAFHAAAAAEASDSDDMFDGEDHFPAPHSTSGTPSPPPSPPTSRVASPVMSDYGSPRRLVRPRPPETLQENSLMGSPRPTKRARTIGISSLGNKTNTTSRDPLS
jgi:hypothetical protein